MVNMDADLVIQATTLLLLHPQTSYVKMVSPTQLETNILVV
jgi:hypothetical protein